MNVFRICVALLLTLTLGFGCSCNKKQAVAETADKLNSTDLQKDQGNEFAFRLFQQMNKEGANLFFSPYSINSALSMVWGGAKGETADQIAQTMRFYLPQEEHHAAYSALREELNSLQERKKAELNVANGLFQSKKYEDLLLESYSDLLKKYYGSDIYSLDFNDAPGTAGFINKWVLDRTRDRIKDLVSEGHISGSNHGLVLVNAIYFKGNWKTQFDPKSTRKDSFFTRYKGGSGEAEKPVEMMYLKGDFSYAKLPACQIIELPYAEEDLALLVLLPDDINVMSGELGPKNFAQYQASLAKREVKVFLPKFKLDLTLDGLSDALKEMGMKDAFTPDRADFSGIRKAGGGADLYIMDVIHKAFVEVNEEGTEAAAATGVVMATRAAGPDETPVFRADHPFIYMILHKPSNTILFLGKLTDPPKV